MDICAASRVERGATVETTYQALRQIGAARAEHLSMLIEHRTYTVRPGTLFKQIESFKESGLKVQVRHFGEPLAWLIPQVGDVNSYVHIWIFEDFADIEEKHAALVADPEWQTYLSVSRDHGYLVKQESKLMTPADFAPITRPSRATSADAALAKRSLDAHAGN